MTESVIETIAGLQRGKRADAVRAKKVKRTLQLLADNPRHPGLHSHRYVGLDDVFGASIWESYVENRTPSAWRLWWFFGPGEDEISVVDLGPHP
ncbi:MAG: hypothetical protein QM655_10065 [Nocardioidaceae bacterium]